MPRIANTSNISNPKRYGYDIKLDDIFLGDKYKPWRDHHLEDGPKEGVCKSCKIGVGETIEEYKEVYS